MFSLNWFYYIIIVGVFLIFIFLSFLIGKFFGRKEYEIILQEIISRERKDAIKKSRSVLVGNFSEQISPFLPNFPLKPSEVKFIGKPIDFIGFRGLDEGEVSEILFIEVKTNNSRLTKTEKSIKDAILNNKIKFKEYRINLNNKN